MRRKELEEMLIDYGQLMGEKNFTPGMSGNISLRYNDKILITKSGSATGYLEEEDIVLMDFDGNSLDENRKPSSEKHLHIEIYKKRQDINAILHVHSPYLSSFASSNMALSEPVMAENVFYFGEIPIADYALPSSMELAQKTVKFFDKYNAVLMANHGFVVGDSTLRDTYLKLELAEAYAQVVLNTKILGGAKLLSKSEVKAIQSLK